jgi:hypothetical protein
MLDGFWEDIAEYVSTGKINEMVVNLLPNLRKSTPKKRSPKSIEKKSDAKRKRTSVGATTAQKKSKTKK